MAKKEKIIKSLHLELITWNGYTFVFKVPDTSIEIQVIAKDLPSAQIQLSLKMLNAETIKFNIDGWDE